RPATGIGARGPLTLRFGTRRAKEGAAGILALQRPQLLESQNPFHDRSPAEGCRRTAGTCVGPSPLGLRQEQVGSQPYVARLRGRVLRGCIAGRWCFVHTGGTTVHRGGCDAPRTFPRPAPDGYLSGLSSEAPWVCRRLQLLRDWGHETGKEVLPGGAGAGGSAGVRARA